MHPTTPSDLTGHPYSDRDSNSTRHGLARDLIPTGVILGDRVWHITGSAFVWDAIFIYYCMQIWLDNWSLGYHPSKQWHIRAFVVSQKNLSLHRVSWWYMSLPWFFKRERLDSESCSWFQILRKAKKFGGFFSVSKQIALNLGNGFWGHFWPRSTKTRYIFLIGQSYSTLLEVFLTNTGSFQNVTWCVQIFSIQSCYMQTPRSNLGVKFDPKTI